MKQQLHQKQVQKLILAPALQQAIKLLPLTNLELIEIIDEELSQNPMLEIEEESMEVKAEEEKPPEKTEEEKPQEKAEDMPRSGEALESQKKEEEDQDLEAYFQEYFDNSMRSYFVEKREVPDFENFVSKTDSLWDHLEWQSNLTFSDEKDRLVAQYIIGNINDDGYLISTKDEIITATGASAEQVEEIRDKIKRFDPIGIGSMDLREVLLAQMEYFKIEDPLTRRIVDEFLPLLEKSDFAQLAKVLNISPAEVKSHIEIIKGLDPAPGRKYSKEKTFYIVPDIIVRKEDDELKIILNDEGMPRLRINSFYKKMLAQMSKEDSEASQFLRDRMKKAFWFLRSLNQRNQTIYKVAKYIVDKQKDFIEKGMEFIKPLTLIELAQEIGVHESTVGRVVANKYIMTSRGVFPLKYFFHKSLSGDFGEEISSLRVKEKIKKLVEQEDKRNPLSDIEIEEILAKENFKIARRTVAKYRKQLRIPPSHIRKRKYWMEETQ
ncbi:MAG: RNA polymerase factor sigma-54 [Candidatus Aminicenantes bacterium]|jgi:RNA polymerase sigma-54 factor